MRGMLKLFLFLVLVTALAVPAAAQTATATIHGKVTNESGAVLGGAKIDAVGTASGFRESVTAGPDGSFQLGGLTPAEYTIVVSAPGFEAHSETLTVLVGQNLSLVFVMTPTAVLNESITVSGEQVLIDTKTPEAATNVTTQQIENLPQDDRNFLNFAALAPGIRPSTDPLRKTFAADAQPAEQTNVFIDGVSQKNDVLMGGLVGQDSSRGNPFPQNAVQEFRVITQNYSAQYEKASSAIISAVTKSGGNKFVGQAFWYYQPKAWVAPLPQNFQYSTLTTNKDYHRNQTGISLGGPIVQDKLHFFAAYEGDDEHATTPVSVANANFINQFSQFTGVFPSPFRSNLGFGKLSWQPADNMLVDWSGTYRKEHEIRDFGTANNPPASAQSATDLKNWVYGSMLRHQWNSDKSLNQAALSWQEYDWNPTPVRPDLVGQNFEGVLRIGGNTSEQRFDQRRWELRDDFNFIGPKWKGDQSIQVGGNLDFLRYNVLKFQNGNPQFNYRNDPANGFTFAQPFEALFGFGNPKRSTSNQEYGVYAQDNWGITSNLTVNVGLRWDYESHGVDSSYVTPANIAAGLAGQVDPSYISTGSQRSQFTDGFQPRVGFSYDLRGDAKSVVFGGVGRYFDRLFQNATLDERYRLQFPVYRIEFSPDGRPGTIKWNDSYLSVAGLHALIASGATSPEIYLLNNNTKPPYSNQWNLGFRQVLGSWIGSVSYNGVRGYRGFTWLSASGICCKPLVPGFGNTIISDPRGKRYWFDGIYLTLDRPYRGWWGAHLAWTHGIATQTGNDLFSLDYLMAGVLLAQSYFDRAVPDETAIRATAEKLYERVDWPWEQPRAPAISMGWTPEEGYHSYDWRGYNEAMIVIVLALGSADHPVAAGAWDEYTKTDCWGSFYGQDHVLFAPLFGHQYSHVWIDLRGIRDRLIGAHGIDYFENSRRATLAQHAYAVDNPGGYRDYGDHIWGLSACDGPMDATVMIDGRARTFRGYSARGATAGDVRDDGTITPTAAASSIVFAPELAIAAIREMSTRYGASLYETYGFLDAFNPTLRTGTGVVQGRVDPARGWFDTDYLGIDEGPIVAMIENYRSGLVWRVMRRNPHLVRGLRRAGFTGGWLAATESASH